MNLHPDLLSNPPPRPSTRSMTPVDHLCRDLGCISLVTPIRQLDFSGAAAFAAACELLIDQQQRHPEFERVNETVTHRLAIGGWLDRPLPRGLVEAQRVVELAGRLESCTTRHHLALHEAAARSAAARLACEELLWVKVAVLHGFSEAAGQAMATLAPTWPSGSIADWTELTAIATAIAADA